MQSRSRLLLQAIPSLRVQRLPTKFTPLLRTVSSDASKQTARNWRDSRGPRRHPEQRSVGPWISLFRETSGPSCTLSYAEKQARWNEKFPVKRNPSKDVFFKNLPPFVATASILSTFPAIQTITYRTYDDHTCAVRFGSVEEAQAAVEAVNSADEFPFPVPQPLEYDPQVKFLGPVRANYVESSAMEPTNTKLFVSHYQGTEQALKEKLGPYIPADHTLQIRYGPRGQIWIDMGSIDAVKEACKGLSDASYTCEFSLLVAPSKPSKQEDSVTPI